MADVSNRDEADKCKQIARSALAAGDSEKAVRFLQKAKRMCPGDTTIDGLIKQAESGGGGGGSSSGGPTSSEGMRQRTAQSASASSARPAAGAGGSRAGKDGNYTAEQMQLVQRILRTKDYYAILEVDKSASEDTVKKAYKKLALKLHPDKNKAPGAEEAFKKLSKAMQCLSDEDKKEMYNRYGDEERIPQSHQHHYQQDFMTPEDLFAAFFGGGAFPPQHGRRPRQNQGQQGEGAPHAALFQLMPILLLLLLTCASNFATRESGSRFSFSRTGQYNWERSTATLNVQYFVTHDFEDHYNEGTRALAEFEQQVEIYHIRSLKGDCEYSEQVMYKKVMMAKRKGNKEELEAARAHPRPACKQVENIKKRHPRLYQSAMYAGMR
jgi:curved DNA-binding protein CbpA